MGEEASQHAVSPDTMTRKELIARAMQLVPLLRERAHEAEGIRRMPDSNVQALKEAGLFKTIQARRYDGYQMDLHTHLDVVSEIARGCGSTGWCLGVMQAHSWLVALFPVQAQEETYGAHPDTLIAAVLAPRGTAKKVADGFRLSGFWPFGSGCQHADWLILGATVQDDEGQTEDEGEFLVPAGNIKIQDDWYVAGLSGTGSCSLMGQDIFVPAHRMLSLRRAIAGAYPGAHIHAGTLYRSAIVPVLALALTGPALGIAKAALDDFRARLPGRVVAFTAQELQLEVPTTHLQVAEAAMKIEAAHLLLHRSADEIQWAAERDAQMELPARAKVRMACAYAVRQCLEAVETLYMACGGSGIMEANPIQRASRDLHAMNLHGLLNLQTNQEMYGRIVLGLPQNTPLI
jgi:3-hydroxy-9,10-secoandrosta-1,3,5(10)-triene-9,17-dione monooxygenase